MGFEYEENNQTNKNYRDVRIFDDRAAKFIADSDTHIFSATNKFAENEATDINVNNRL